MPVFKPVRLTDAEHRYLTALSPLKIAADPDWAPFNFRGPGGEQQGILRDYLRYLNKALGLQFEFVPIKRYDEVLQAVRNGRADLAASFWPQAPPDTALLLTVPYDSSPLVIVSRKDTPRLSRPSDLAQKRVAVAEGRFAANVVKIEAPEATLVLTESPLAGLKLVQRRDADAFVGNLAVVDLLIRQHFPGLSIDAPLNAAQSLRFAVSPRFRALVPLIDRALSAMPETEKLRIRARWLAANYNYGMSWRELLGRLAPAGTAILVAVLLSWRAYRKLRGEIARRIEVERALADQLAFQHAVLEVIPYPLVARDACECYLVANPAYERAVGLPGGALMGKTPQEAGVSVEGVFQTQALRREVLRSGEPARGEVQVTDLSGKPVTYLYWLQPFKLPGRAGPTTPLDAPVAFEAQWIGETHHAPGTPQSPDAQAQGTHDSQLAVVDGLISTYVDVTEIRLAEERARATEQRLLDVTRDLPAVVFQFKRAAQGEISFLYVGGDAQAIWGVSSSDMLADERNAFATVHPDDQPGLRAEIDASARELRPLSFVARPRVAQGTRWVRCHGVPRREADGATVWSGYWVDITAERERADALAAANEAAVSAAHAKDAFLAMMSHEIRTPMNGVLGLLEVVRHTESASEKARMLETIERSATALLQILDDVLDYSKIEAGQLTLEAVPCDLREVCDDALGLLAARAHEKGLRLRAMVEADVALEVRGDSVRLAQILFNLLSNAIKFTAQGEVELRVAAEPPAPAPAGAKQGATQRLRLTVRDTGIGIAPAQLDALFEPFVQAESSTTRRFGGTGLGLTICKRLSDLMGGTLHIDSTPGVGTTVSLTLNLPVVRRASARTPYQTARVAMGSSPLAESVHAYALAAGLRCNPPPDDVRAVLFTPHTDDMEKPEGVNKSNAVAHAAPGQPVIYLTDAPLPAGYRVTSGRIELSLNPLRWRSFQAACEAALESPHARDIVPARDTRAGVLVDAPAWVARAPRTAPRILVAEDHPVNRELLRYQLDVLGYTADLVENGVAALAAWRTGTYALLITDCHMPNMNGYRLAEAIRAEETRRDTRRLPIVAITASTEQQEKRRCAESGIDACLIKPVRLADLGACVARVLKARVAPRRRTVPAEVPIKPPPEMETQVKTKKRKAENNTPVKTEEKAPTETKEQMEAETGAEMETAGVLDSVRSTYGGDPTIMRAFVATFVEAAREDLRSLTELLARHDDAALHQWAHRQAGAFGVLGYVPLLTRLEAFRTALRGGDTARIERCAAALSHAIETVCARLSEAAY